MDTLRATGALLIVLGLIFFLSWFFKRIKVSKIGNTSVARIVGAVSLGSRERLLVVAVGDQWIVVGVAPGRVTAIAHLDAPGHSKNKMSREDLLDAR
jgi:flagellar protein FliO/FliZ